MKSLLLAPALVSFVTTENAVETVESAAPTPLVAIATVEDRPLIELTKTDFVPIVAAEDEEARVQALRQDLEDVLQYQDLGDVPYLTDDW